MEQIVNNIIQGINWAKKCLVALLVLAATLVFMQTQAIAAPTSDGKLVHSQNTTTPLQKNYAVSTNTFSAGNTMQTGAAQSFMVDRAAPTRNEHIAGYVTTGGVLYIQRWNGTAWSAEWNVTVGGNGVAGRRFDIAYEKTSGRAVVVYSTNATGTTGNEMAYRIWNGTSWTAAANINSARFAQAATVAWIKMKSNPLSGSNEIALTAQDSGTTTANTSVLTSFIWNGTTWTEPTAAHTTATTTYMTNTTGQLVQNDAYDLAYESLSGDLLVVFSTGGTAQQYYITKSAAGTWGTATSFATARTAPLQMVAESNPYTDQIMILFNRSANANVYGRIWSGTAMGTTTTIGTNGVTTAVAKKHLTGKWLRVGTTDYAVALWNTSTAGTFGRNTYTGTAWGTAATYVTGTGVTANWMDSDRDPQSPDTMMITFTTGTTAGAVSLWAKRLVIDAVPNYTFTNADGGAAVSTVLSNATAQPFSFTYNRYFVAAPTLTLPTSTALGSTTATLGATAANNNSAITEYGVVWSTTDTTPTIAEGATKVIFGSSDPGTNPFSGGVTGLTAGTRIYYAGYAINGIGTGYSPTGSFYTEPAAQASNVTFTNVATTSFTVNWTKGAGDGALVLIRAAGAPTGAPTDGTYTTYTATAASPFGTAIGDGNVIYRSTGSSVNVTGLTNGTTYYVAVFSYAGAVNTAGVDIGTNYITASPATGSQQAGLTTPVIGALNVTPLVTTYTSGAPTVTASINSPAGTPDSCEYTVNNGANWDFGSLSGVASPYTCTANPVGLSGSVTINMRATNSFGTGTGTAVTYTADGSLPVISVQSPLDGSKIRMEDVTLTATVSDTGSGLADYRIIVLNENQSVFADTGWVATTGAISYSPAGLAYDKLYYWDLSVRDKVGNVVAADQRMVGTYPACVRNQPAISLSTAAGAISTKIITDAGSSSYVMKVTNNDSLGCAANTFTLTASNNADTPEELADKAKFNDPSLALGSIIVSPGGQSGSVNLTVSAKTANGADVSGVAYTTAAAASANHASRTTNQVLTILNVAGCTLGTPILNIGPDTTYAARGGSANYSVSVKNTDYGANCTPVTYTFSKSDSPVAPTPGGLFTSTLSDGSLTLEPGQAKIATLKVTSTSSAVNTSSNITTVNITAPSHSSPPAKTATTTIGDMMLHNSDNIQSTKWSANGGWGLPGTRYGEFTCGTCHVPGGGDTRNISRINETIFTPHTTANAYLPLNGKAVAFTRVSAANKNQASFGWDNGRDKTLSPVRICEGCHTDDQTGANGTKFHSMNTDTTRASHFDGKDCVKCHKHKAGFGLGAMNCNTCHGDSTATETSAANRWAVAPPRNANDLTGTLTGTGQVSNDPKVGAHQTHMKMLNGLSDFGTFDDRCMNCHGPIPINTKHMDGNSLPKFQGLANLSTAGKKVATSYNATSLTCATYCHNPSATNGTLAAANAGTAVFPSWTSTSYLGDTLKTDANCNKCHKSPGASGFTFQASHSQSTVVGYACTDCHGHEGGTGGAAGQKHMDGIRYAAGYCNSCHDYDTVGTTWGTVKPQNYGGFGEGVGAHAKHINYLKSRWGIATLDPVADGTTGFGSGNAKNICGVCHTNDNANHMTGNRVINFGENTNSTAFGTQSQFTRYVFGSAATYNGDSTKSSNTQLKTCSNLSCHYFTTPVWSTY